MSYTLCLSRSTVSLVDYRGKKVMSQTVREGLGEWTLVETAEANRTHEVRIAAYGLSFSGIDRIVWAGPFAYKPEVTGPCPSEVLE